MIPAFPAATAKTRIGYEALGNVGSDVVVLKCRMCGEQHRVSRQRFEAGEFDMPTASESHLAEQWRELRKAEDAAFADMFKVWDDFTIYADSPVTIAFCEARDARVAFEQQHQIGGGT